MEKPKNQATLCIPYNRNKILLGMKKRGFGLGKYNGFGGKVISGETIEETTLRELQEESGLYSNLKYLKKFAELDFFFPYKTEWNQIVHVYIISTFFGEPRETEEMTFQWFNRDKIPYSKMWDDDKYWLPLVLDGKRLQATFIFREKDGENVVDYKDIKKVENLEKVLSQEN